MTLLGLALPVFAAVGLASAIVDTSDAARRLRDRYSVSVAIGTPRTAISLPDVRGGDRSLPLVVIDPGHGGHDPGAGLQADGVREKHVTLSLARAVRERLLSQGRVRVALTRDSDRFLVLEERFEIARQLNADLFVSIHADSAADPKASGASIYTLSEVASGREAARLAARENRSDILAGSDLGRQTSSVGSILIDLAQREAMATAADFAAILAREGTKLFKLRDVPRQYAGFIVLKSPDTPSVLFEAGYLSNPQDAAFLTSTEGQARVATGLSRAIGIHFAKRRAAR